MKSRRSRFGCLPAATLAAALGGCAGPVRYDASVPQGLPPGSTGTIRRQTIRLEFPGLSLSAQVQSYDWSGRHLPEPLGVWLYLDARDGRFAIDPAQVTLSADRSRPLQPVAFLGPADSWRSPRAIAAGCGPRWYAFGMTLTKSALSPDDIWWARRERGVERPTVGPVRFAGKKCFMFWYDTDPLPHHAFTLSVAGITRDGKPLAARSIRFAKGRLTGVSTIP